MVAMQAEQDTTKNDQQISEDIRRVVKPFTINGPIGVGDQAAVLNQDGTVNSQFTVRIATVGVWVVGFTLV
jgi:hypothetical protein